MQGYSAFNVPPLLGDSGVCLMLNTCMHEFKAAARHLADAMEGVFVDGDEAEEGAATSPGSSLPR